MAQIDFMTYLMASAKQELARQEVIKNIEAQEKRVQAIRQAGIDAIERARTFA
jgi:hypothetical protein